jgi:hypothetical protein
MHQVARSISCSRKWLQASQSVEVRSVKENKMATLAVDPRIFDSMNADENQSVIGFLYAIRAIKSITGHGEIEISMADGKIKEMSVKHSIKPHVMKPWDCAIMGSRTPDEA